LSGEVVFGETWPNDNMFNYELICMKEDIAFLTYIFKSAVNDHVDDWGGLSIPARHTRCGQSIHLDKKRFRHTVGASTFVENNPRNIDCLIIGKWDN
jgi:hypothetical protein